MTEITTSAGTTVTIGEPLAQGGRPVIVDHPDAPFAMRHHTTGRVIQGAFQPEPFAEYAITPETLRAIADLIEADVP